jgi:hypothetical protein
LNTESYSLSQKVEEKNQWKKQERLLSQQNTLMVGITSNARNTKLCLLSKVKDHCGFIAA